MTDRSAHSGEDRGALQRTIALPIWVVVAFSVAFVGLATLAVRDNLPGAARFANQESRANGPMYADALKALKSFDAALQVGLTYEDYSRRLADTYIPVLAYLESEEAQSAPEVAADVQRAADLYKAAMEIWTIHVKKSDSYGLHERRPYFRRLLQVYPRAEQFVERQSEGKGWVDVSRVQQDAWEQASKAVSQLPVRS